MHEVILPRLGVTMESGAIERWCKKVGDRVTAGEVLFELTTDKATQEIEAEVSGHLLCILRQEGEEVPVAEVIAYLGEPGEQIPHVASAAPATAVSQMDAVPAVATVAPAPRKDTRRRISPYARKCAAQQGVVPEKLEGTGPGGRIKARDVTAYLAKLHETAPRKAGGAARVAQSGPLTGLRKIIAEKMTRSKSTIPHVTLQAVADVTLLRERYRALKAAFHANVTITDCLLRTTALALRKNLFLNAQYSDNTYSVFENINIGMAAAAEAGLMVMTFYDCDRASLQDIAARRSALLDRVGNGPLPLQDITNSTFTLTNLGMYGVRSFMPIINPPQVGILGVGEIYESPVLRDNVLTNRAFVELTLACDHRVVDGAQGALFLKCLRQLLEQPGEWLD